MVGSRSLAALVCSLVLLACGVDAFLVGAPTSRKPFGVDQLCHRTNVVARNQAKRRVKSSIAALAAVEGHVGRRELLSGLLISLGAAQPAGAFGDYGAHNFNFLSQRATGPANADFDNPGFGYDSCFGLCSDKQLYYPSWLQGDWKVESTYAGKAFPKGEEFVYRNLRGGSARSASEKIGDVTKFAARYVQAKTGGTVLGFGAGSEAVISDRSYNTVELLNAYAGFGRILRVDYSPDKDPTRMVMQYPSLGPDMQPLPPKRTEVFINNRDAALSPDGNVFACSEVYRAVTLGPGQSAVADSENVYLFRRESDGSVVSRQRSLVYLVPSPNSKEGDLYMQVGGKAVAVYDYDVRMASS
mmetsp:Transcript_29725/g.60023  ORF Transcript_29725/g.60023 Transcript_29725/m.60023 type:complete len:357 (-) Transcript_29725:100-1170(-)